MRELGRLWDRFIDMMRLSIYHLTINHLISSSVSPGSMMVVLEAWYCILYLWWEMVVDERWLMMRDGRWDSKLWDEKEEIIFIIYHLISSHLPSLMSHNLPSHHISNLNGTWRYLERRRVRWETWPGKMVDCEMSCEMVNGKLWDDKPREVDKISSSLDEISDGSSTPQILMRW